jgi:hypothetical protein
MAAETDNVIDNDGDSRAVLYDAVGEIWLNFYGNHVHLGAFLLLVSNN